jgi:hypothetical protein
VGSPRVEQQTERPAAARARAPRHAAVGGCRQGSRRRQITTPHATTPGRP